MVFHVGARLAKTPGVYLIQIPRDVELGFFEVAKRENIMMAEAIARWIMQNFPAEMRTTQEPVVVSAVPQETKVVDGHQASDSGQVKDERAGGVD